MLSRIGRRLASDSPFRYGMRLRVSPEIRQKDFGNDVLLFATPKRLKREAESVLNGVSDRTRGKAFWEIFTKRANESIHLLDGTTICLIIRALSAHGGSSELVSGLCHFVADDLGSGRRISPRYPSIDLMIEVMQALNANLISVPVMAYHSLVLGLADMSHTIRTSQQVFDMMSQLRQMRPSSDPMSPNEQVLLQMLIGKLGRANETNVSFDEVFRLASEVSQ